MITDKRQRLLAKNLVNYSCEVQKGENVLIEASGVPYQFVNLLVQEVYAAGGYPFVSIGDNKIKREIMKGGSEELFKRMAKYDEMKMRDMQAYIGIRGGENSFELSDANGEIMQAYSKYYAHPVHHDLRVKKTKWVILRYPTEGMSELAGMSTEAYEDFYFDVCCLDYKKMGEAMTPLVELMNKTDKVRIVAKDTDLTFSIKGIGAVKCKGERNIPDGEVYTAPVKDSVNGVIHYNVPSIEDGMETVCSWIDRLFEAAEPVSFSPRISHIILYISDHYTEDLTLQRIADDFHISPVYLSRSFKAETGKNI